MENFRFCVGTEILFGKGQISHLPEALKNSVTAYFSPMVEAVSRKQDYMIK